MRAHALNTKSGIKVYVTNLALRFYIEPITLLKQIDPSNHLDHPKADECIIKRTMIDGSINYFHTFCLHCISLSRLASKRYLLTLEIQSISFDTFDGFLPLALPFEDQVDTNKLSGRTHTASSPKILQMESLGKLSLQEGRMCDYILRVQQTSILAFVETL